jgi:4-hydroxy-tetrahydrodipicolinate reductase
MPAGARQYGTSKRSSPIRVVQCFTGGVGSECVRRIVKHPDMTLVGVLVHSADKDGRDAGELVGIGPIGITATRDLDRIIALHPDVAIWHRHGYEPALIAKLLAAGINVYTAFGGHDVAGQPEEEVLERACRTGGSTFAAAGNIPGLISDALPIFLSGFTDEIRHIKAVQRNHVAHYPSAAQLVAGLGLGLPMPGAADVENNEVDGMWEWLMAMSARTVARAIGIPFDGLRTALKEVRPAPRSLTLPGSGYLIEEGTIGGVRWTWEARSGDEVFLTIVNEQTAVFGLGDGWRADDDAPAWTVEIAASPPLVATLSWPDGVAHAQANSQLNAARAINMVPVLVEAPPGCRTILDLAMISGYAAGRTPGRTTV